jgi:hypothetical protein
MLGRLSFSGWAGEIKDSTSSRKIEADNGAVEGASKAKKVLLPGVVELEAIQKFAAATRTWWHGVSVPWEDGGARAYSAARHIELLTDIGDRQREYDRLVDAFVAKYPTAYAEQQFRLNHLFNAADYPDPSTIRDKFAFNFHIRPIADAEDIRVIEGLTDQEADRLIAQAKEAEREQVQAAVDDAYKKLYKVIKAMADKLAVPVGEKGSTFRSSLISNIRDLAEVMPGLNITNDPQLNALAAKAMQLTGYTAEDLKSSGLRAEVQKRAAELAGMFTTVSQPAPAPAPTVCQNTVDTSIQDAAAAVLAGINWDE